jgi:putative nucleotidyltransferase with HDIG domain
MILPPLEFPPNAGWLVPDEAACVRMWDGYSMLPHIRAHCRAVCGVAGEIARRAADRGWDVSPDMVKAAALLHDIAKTYSIRYGGGHAQLGAAWVREETGNQALAQAVLFHVSWPWEEGPLAPLTNPLRLPFIISYADKRVRHDQIVTLEERFADLQDRYGKTERHRTAIRRNQEQALCLERALFDRVGPL